MFGASCLHQGLSSAVCEEGWDKARRSNAIALTIETISL